MDSGPERATRPGHGISPQGSSAPRASGGSVLDKYPERDLSHLTGAGAAAPRSGGVPPPPPDTVPDESGFADPVTPDADAIHEGESSPVSTDAAEAKMSSSSSKGPLIAFLTIAAILILVAFIWHINPWPSLKDRIAGLFRTEEPATVQSVPAAGPSATESEPEPTLRAWDFFLQVSSWKELGQADLDAERYRAQGFDAIVESEFIPSKGGTWYRVRLGPYESSTAAREFLAANAAALPKGIYLDSVRLSEEVPMAPAPASVGTGSQKQSPRSSRTGTAAQIPGRDFEVIEEPMSGWAVKVSSLKSEDLARQEARKVLEQGYPSFITRKRISGITWYRVLVGPFSDKRDADRYQQLLNVTYGNDAYTVDLSAN